MSTQTTMLMAFDPKTFILAGNATFTATSEKTGVRFTFKVVNKNNYFHISVLTGSDNTSNYTYIGTIFPDGVYRHGRKSRITPDAPSAKAAAWICKRVVASETIPNCTIQHAGRCGRCGRLLTVPESIESGFGPECITKLSL